MPHLLPPSQPRWVRADSLPLVADVSLLQLARLRRLMAADGEHVDVPRMCLDRLYAMERIARAHASADTRLRALALAMFQAYHVERHAGALH
jgi:hypothetical protein